MSLKGRHRVLSVIHTYLAHRTCARFPRGSAKVCLDANRYFMSLCICIINMVSVCIDTWTLDPWSHRPYWVNFRKVIGKLMSIPLQQLGNLGKPGLMQTNLAKQCPWWKESGVLSEHSCLLPPRRRLHTCLRLT